MTAICDGQKVVSCDGASFFGTTVGNCGSGDAADVRILLLHKVNGKSTPKRIKEGLLCKEVFEHFLFPRKGLRKYIILLLLLKFAYITSSSIHSLFPFNVFPGNKNRLIQQNNSFHSLLER